MIYGPCDSHQPWNKLVPSFSLLNEQTNWKMGTHREWHHITQKFHMRISLLQSIGIIGTMTVEFPVDVKGIFSWMSIFVLDAWLVSGFLIVQKSHVDLNKKTIPILKAVNMTFQFSIKAACRWGFSVILLKRIWQGLFHSSRIRKNVNSPSERASASAV